MLPTTLLLASLLAADAGADPFAPSGQHLAMGDFFPAPKPATKPSPYAHDETAADSLEWWALEQDWAETVREAAPLVEVLSTRQGQRIVYSALICHAATLLIAEGETTEVARRRLARVGALATERLEAARIEALTCEKYPVERLTNCLSLLPGPECSEPELALQTKAAERLEQP